MKCVKSVSQPADVYRTSEEEASKMVKSGKYCYCSNTEWRGSGRKYLTAKDEKIGNVGRQV